MWKVFIDFLFFFFFNLKMLDKLIVRRSSDENVDKGNTWKKSFYHLNIQMEDSSDWSQNRRNRELKKFPKKYWIRKFIKRMIYEKRFFFLLLFFLIEPIFSISKFGHWKRNESVLNEGKVRNIFHRCLSQNYTVIVNGSLRMILNFSTSIQIRQISIFSSIA